MISLTLSRGCLGLGSLQACLVSGNAVVWSVETLLAHTFLGIYALLLMHWTSTRCAMSSIGYVAIVSLCSKCMDPRNFIILRSLEAGYHGSLVTIVCRSRKFYGRSGHSSSMESVSCWRVWYKGMRVSSSVLPFASLYLISSQIICSRWNQIRLTSVLVPGTYLYIACKLNVLPTDSLFQTD